MNKTATRYAHVLVAHGLRSRPLVIAGSLGGHSLGRHAWVPPPSVLSEYRKSDTGQQTAAGGNYTLTTISVPTWQEVLETFRQDLVAQLRMARFAVPPDAEVPGNYYQALAAWVRLQHRTVPSAARKVWVSEELSTRSLEPTVQESLDAIRLEIQRGEDMTPRLTRQFYRSGFNDFLFNNFGIQHLHLGQRGAGKDRTKQHAMAGGGVDVLFAKIGPGDAHFLDVQDHSLFHSAEKTKSLLRITLKNWPDLLRPYVAPRVVGCDVSFETAFNLAKSGFGTVFDLDGVFLVLGGTVLDGKVSKGKRAPCTSVHVTRATNRLLERIVSLVRFAESQADAIAQDAGARSDTRIAALQLRVVGAGPIVLIRELNTGTDFFCDGQNQGTIKFGAPALIGGRPTTVGRTKKTKP